MDRGVSGLSFASVGSALGIADRTVVYYFPTKAELLEAAVRKGSESLSSLLGSAFGDAPITAERAAERAWPVMSSDDAAPWIRVYFELVGRGAAGEEPHGALAREITSEWIRWLADRIDGGTVESRLSAATGVVAQIDGRLLLRLIGADG